MNRFILIVCLLMTGCSAHDQKKAQHHVSRVEVTVAEERDVPIMLTAKGIFSAASGSLSVSAQVTGIITKHFLYEGAIVNKGDPLFQLDDRPFQAALQQAMATLRKDEATLELAKITVERNKDLATKNYISKLIFEEYQAAVKIAEAQVDIDLASVDAAKVNLSYTIVTAPIRGRMATFDSWPGSLVFPGGNSITQMSPSSLPVKELNVDFSLPERKYLKMLEVKDNWPLKIEASPFHDPERKYVGTIKYIDNSYDPLNDKIFMKAVIEDPDVFVIERQMADIRIILRTESHAIVIPDSAVELGPEGYYVYVIHPDMTAQSTRVEVGNIIDKEIVIFSGLKSGDTVVTNGQFNLKNGTTVEIVENRSAK